VITLSAVRSDTTEIHKFKVRNKMKVLTLNIYAAIAAFFLSVATGQQEVFAGNKKTVNSGGGVVVKNSSQQAEEAVIAGGATLIFNTNVLQTPSAPIDPSVPAGPSAVRTLVLDLNMVPATATSPTVVAGADPEILGGKKRIISGGGTIVENHGHAGKVIIAGGATIVRKTPSAMPAAMPTTMPATMPSTAPSTTPSTAPSTAPSTNPSVAPSVSPSAEPSTGPSAEPTPVLIENVVAAPSPAPSLGVTADNSTAPRSSGVLGMLLLSMLPWVISL
jgi:hypothetical protein